MDRLLVNTSGTVSLTVTDATGAPKDLDALPAVTVYDGAGTSLATGTATKPGTGSYSFAVPSTATTKLDTLRIFWDGAISAQNADFTTYCDVVSGDPITVAEIRAASRSLTDQSKYPFADVARARDEAVTDWETAANVATVLRGRRISLDGTDTDTLLIPDVLPTQLYSVTVNGTTVDPTTVSLREYGALVRPYSSWPCGVKNVVLHYAHGMTSVPSPLKRALRILTTTYLVPAAQDPRATALSTDVGTFRLTIAGRDGAFGIPDVDATVERYGYRIGFA